MKKLVFLLVVAMLALLGTSCGDYHVITPRENITGKVMVRAFQENLGTTIQVSLATFNTFEEIEDMRLTLKIWFEASEEEYTWVVATLDQTSFDLNSQDEYIGSNDPDGKHVRRYYYRLTDPIDSIIGYPLGGSEMNYDSYQLDDIDRIRQYGINIDFKINGIWYSVPYTENAIKNRPDYPFGP